MLSESRLARLFQAIADELRSCEIPLITKYFSETYRGPIGADDLRAVVHGYGDTDAAGAERLKHTMDGTGQASHSGGEQPDSGHPAVHEAQPQDQRDAPLIVADELERIHSSGVRARWERLALAESPHREFEAWMTSPTEGPLPPLSPDSGLTCWEMLLWAGARNNVISHAKLHRMYAQLAEFRRTGMLSWPLKRDLLPHEVRRYIPGDSANLPPQRGDVIMWGNGAHVAMATGRTAPDGAPEVYSFWPPPKHPVPRSEAMVTDAVQITSIDELERVVNPPHRRPPREILFGRGPW